jgi:hypothetical protein
MRRGAHRDQHGNFASSYFFRSECPTATGCTTAAEKQAHRIAPPAIARKFKQNAALFGETGRSIGQHLYALYGEPTETLFGETRTERLHNRALFGETRSGRQHFDTDNALHKNRLDLFRNRVSRAVILLRRYLGRRELFGVTRRVIWEDSKRFGRPMPLFEETALTPPQPHVIDSKHVA